MDKTLERTFLEQLESVINDCFILIDDVFEEDNTCKLSDNSRSIVQQAIIQKTGKLNIRLADVFNKIADNLDECQTSKQVELYVIDLLRHFKEYSDRFHPERLIKVQEENIKAYEDKSETDLCRMCEKEIERLKDRANKYYDLCFTGKRFEFEDGTAENCLIKWIDIIIWFAKKLDALLLERGFDLLQYQDKICVYLIRQDRIEIDTDYEYLGGIERAEELIKKVRRSYNSEEQKKTVLSFKNKYCVYFKDCDDFINSLQKIKARDLAREYKKHLLKSNISMKEFCDDCFMLTPQRKGESGWNYENVRKR